MTALLTADGVRVRLGGRLVLDGADIAVDAGQMVGLVGPNGAGKTTLLRAIAGLQSVESGVVRLVGRRLDTIGARAIARELAFLPHGAPCHWALTVRRVVALGRLPRLGRRQRTSPADAAAVDAAMEDAGVAMFADRPVSSLSAGERMRVMVARTLAQQPRVLLADEPTAALDPYHQLRVMELLHRRAVGGAAVVAVLHDLSLAARYCGRLVLLRNGRVEAEGSPADVLTPTRIRSTYGVDAVSERIGERIFTLPTETSTQGLRAKRQHAVAHVEPAQAVQETHSE